VDPAPRKRSLGSSRHLCFGRARTVADASNLDVEHLAWADRDRCARGTAYAARRGPIAVASGRAEGIDLHAVDPAWHRELLLGPVYANAHVTACWVCLQFDGSAASAELAKASRLTAIAPARPSSPTMARGGLRRAGRDVAVE
jgi:hypothetical protein